MKSLYLLRHAKSDRSGYSGSDHERPLNARGVDAAPEVGQFLRRNGITPGHVVCSSARRTRQTLEGVIQGAGWKEIPTDFDRRIYLTGTDTVLDALANLDSQAASVLIVGHEPTMESLASGLIGGGRIRFPTAALACINLSISSWTHIRRDCGVLVFHRIPRLSKND